MPYRLSVILRAIAHGSTRLLGLFTLPTVLALVGATVLIWGLAEWPWLARVVTGAALVALAIGLGRDSIRGFLERRDN